MFHLLGKQVLASQVFHREHSGQLVFLSYI